MQKNQTKKAALYIRVSTHYQIDKDSLPFQRNELINYAKYALGIDDYAIFEDAGYSGKNTDRPAYQDMMRRIRAKEFSHLCVWKIDRISRNLLDFAAMYEELKKFNCTFVSKNEQFDTSSAIGEAMLRIILVFAELERKLTAERVTSIMYSRANKGLWNGAPIPLGYKWDAKGKYPVIDEDTAVVVRYIYDQYEKIHSTMKLSDKLNRENIKSARGGEWTGTTVKGILRNPFYKGTYRYNYKTQTGRIKPVEEQIMFAISRYFALVACSSPSRRRILSASLFLPASSAGRITKANSIIPSPKPKKPPTHIANTISSDIFPTDFLPCTAFGGSSFPAHASSSLHLSAQIACCTPFRLRVLSSI